jgi:uncharacterized protein YndB with AHSA1/START domain/uncharacterized protein YdhG (YjbR/CyaY superfamily)
MNTTTVTTPSELEITVERVFDAPRAHVFSVWTDPQLIPEWWGNNTVVEEMDVRPGGTYRFRTDFGVVEGEFREVEPPERLVQTFQNHLQTLEFEDLGQQTKLTQTMRFETTEQRDTTMQYGVEEGAKAGFAQIDALLQRLASTRRRFAMAEKKPAKKGTQKGFTAEERAAMKERAKELKAEREGKAGESDLLAKLAEMPKSDRAMGERIHALVKANAPSLSPKTWYGMPAYAKDGKVVCFFQSADKFKARYATFGFSDQANLDEGAMWPTSFALKKLTAADEKKIVKLLKKAVS